MFEAVKTNCYLDFFSIIYFSQFFFIYFVFLPRNYEMFENQLFCWRFFLSVVLVASHIFSLADVGVVLQVALCLHLHRPLADHMGLSLPCLCSAFRCASYPFFPTCRCIYCKTESPLCWKVQLQSKQPLISAKVQLDSCSYSHKLDVVSLTGAPNRLCHVVRPGGRLRCLLHATQSLPGQCHLHHLLRQTRQVLGERLQVGWQ